MVFLKEDHVYLWDLAWKDYMDYKDCLWRMLSAQEQEKSLQRILPASINQFIITRGLLKILMGYLLNQPAHTLQFDYTTYKKPYIRNNQGLEFNVSHTSNRVLYGFALNTSIGVDIEDSTRTLSIDNLAHRYFSIQENSQLARLSCSLKQQAFFKGWTQKEAIAKAYGLGLQMRFHQIEVNINKGLPRLIQIHNQALQHLPFLLYPVPAPKHYHAVIAIQNEQENFKIDYQPYINPRLLYKMISYS